MTLTSNINMKMTLTKKNNDMTLEKRDMNISMGENDNLVINNNHDILISYNLVNLTKILINTWHTNLITLQEQFMLTPFCNKHE